MKVDSLGELRSAFAMWRKKKRHAREAMPEELLHRARRAAKKHGVSAVVRATRVERSRLFRIRAAERRRPGASRAKAKGVARSVPTFLISATAKPSRFDIDIRRMRAGR